MRVYLVESGSGREVPVGTAASFEEATKLVEDLDARWDAGEPVDGYEGCDLYAADGDLLYFYDGDDTWSIVDWR